jgi:hypothetical protein
VGIDGFRQSDLAPLATAVRSAPCGIDGDQALAQLRSDVAAPFNLGRLTMSRAPLRALTAELGDFEWPHRINQCLVKTRNSERVKLGPFASIAAAELVDRCIQTADDLHLGWQDRYLYLTIDTRPVEVGETQRVPGWHVDDLQGPDILTKRPGGFLFVGASSLPTEFAIQQFAVDGLDDTKHNVFDWCGRQVQPSAVVAQWPNTIALMSAYDVHRGVPAVVEGPRVFVRLLLTHCALTSAKTTINPAIEYDHAPHSTDGRIPAHLV